MSIRTSFSKNLFHYFALFLICVLAVLIRLYSVVNYESLIHEFDPWFNFRVVEYMSEHGIGAFMKWRDSMSWYPLGRHMGNTTYPAMMATAVLAHRLLTFLGIPVAIRNVCVFLGPFMAGLNSIVIYLITRKAWSPSAGIFAALLSATSPGYIQRSVAGSFDYEAVAIFVMNLSFYLWMRAYESGSLVAGALAALAYFYMTAVWGGYLFVLNLIAIFTFVSVIVGNLDKKLYKAYTSWYIVGSYLTTKVPVVYIFYTKKAMHYPAFLTFLLVQFAMLLKTILNSHKKQKTKRLIMLFLTASLVSGLALYKIVKSGVYGNVHARILQIVGLSHGIDLVSSVAEHGSGSVMNIYSSLGKVCFAFPISLVLLSTNPNRHKFFVGLYMTLIYLFSLRMVRLVVVLATPACIAAGIVISVILNLPSLMTKRKIISVPSTLFAAFFVFQLYTPFIQHSIKYGKASSSPSIMLKFNSGEIIDDFRDGFSWVRQNTAANATVLSWWDYGYQITGLSRRAVYVDNNTRNNRHIALIGMILSSPEEEAYRHLLNMNTDYVLVFFGGKLGYSGDDLAKAYWIFKISSGHHKSVIPIRSMTLNKNGDPYFQNSILFKMCYYRFSDTSNGGYDFVRKQKLDVGKIEFKYFEEAFTSDNWIFRLYRVKKLGELSPEDRAKFEDKDE